ncbi:MAG TPA: class I SAM-dependent methyltransferase [Microlunatus sp.]|nr:class I SAM-dependent methyltransferase [Microlunatus sp.]
MSGEELSRSFGAAADAYESGRPGYPLEAVSWLVGEPRRAGRRTRVADVGAGTGKLTRAVAELEAEVVAVDPDPNMLARLHRALPGVPTFLGTAERLPLPDASVDVVVLGQAWHWVEPTAGSTEVARVLRAGGRLGLIWNLRDESEPWVARLTGVLGGSTAERMVGEGRPTLAPPFDTVESRMWRWSRTLTRGELFDLARSRSALITAAADRRHRMEQSLADLCDELGLSGDATIELPYITRAFRASRP